MGINKAIRNLVYDNILMDEHCKFSFVENQVSIFDLLKVQRSRNTNSKNCFYQYLDGESQYIDLAYFSENWWDSDCDNAIFMNFWFTKIGNIMCKKPVLVRIRYCDGKLSILDVDKETLELELLRENGKTEEILELELLKRPERIEEIKKVENEICLFKDIMLDKYKDSLIKIARYGIINNYNKELKLNTISREFVVDLDNCEFTLSLSSEILFSANKQFYLSYYYDWESDTISSGLSHHYTVRSNLGPWRLQTNIPYMKSLITKSVADNHDRNIGNGIDSLCHNLKVDYEELPRYLQVEVDKVKSLRK